MKIYLDAMGGDHAPDRRADTRAPLSLAAGALPSFGPHAIHGGAELEQPGLHVGPGSVAVAKPRHCMPPQPGPQASVSWAAAGPQLGFIEGG